MEKDIHFFLPKRGDWRNVKFLKIIERKEASVDLHWMEKSSVGPQLMVCNGDDCPICAHINKERSLWIRLLTFFLDVKIAFSKLFKKRKSVKCQVVNKDKGGGNEKAKEGS